MRVTAPGAHPLKLCGACGHRVLSRDTGETCPECLKPYDAREYVVPPGIEDLDGNYRTPPRKTLE